MTIHKKIITSEHVNFYFTKSKDLCLLVEYNRRKDYGKNNPSFTELKIELCYFNSFIKDDLIEIQRHEVPGVIIDALTFYN